MQQQLHRMLVNAARALSRGFRYLRGGQAANWIFGDGCAPLAAAGSSQCTTTFRRQFTGMLRQHERLGLLQQISVVAQRRYQRQLQVPALLPQCSNVQHTLVLFAAALPVVHSISSLWSKALWRR